MTKSWWAMFTEFQKMKIQIQIVDKVIKRLLQHLGVKNEIQYFEKDLSIAPTLVAEINSLVDLKKRLVMNCKEKFFVYKENSMDLMLGVFYYYIKDYEKSILIFDRIISHSSLCVPALHNKALVLHKQGRISEALVYYNRVVELDQKYIPLIKKYIPDVLQEGMYLAGLGRDDEALNCYNFILSLEPGNVDVIYYKSFSKLRQGAYDESATLIEKLAKTDSRYFELIKNEKCFDILDLDKRFDLLIN